MEFQNKVAIITGAASGMGKLTAENLIAQGARVTVADITPVEENENLLYVSCDVRKYAEITNVVEKTIERFGKIDYVINCAGGDGIRILKGVRDYIKVDPDILEWEIDVNLKGPMLLAKAALPYMVEQKSGVILNLGSICGAEASSGSIGYSTAKSGIMNGFTQSLAKYCAPHGIRVVTVSPGPVLTRAAMANMKTLIGRAAEPQEVVDLMLYLLSDKAAFITGTNYFIDGGRYCMGKA